MLEEIAKTKTLTYDDMDNMFNPDDAFCEGVNSGRVNLAKELLELLNND